MMTKRRETVLTIMSSIALVLAIVAIFLTQVHYEAQEPMETTTATITPYLPPEITPEPSILPSQEQTKPSSTTVEVLKPRYVFTDEEVYLLAQLLCGDEKISGDGEYDFVWKDSCVKSYYKEMAKVLCVVMNRQRSSDFPNTVKEVILQKGQFSVIPNNLDATPPLLAIQIIQKWCDQYNNYEEATQVVPESHLYFHAGPNNTNISSKTWK